MSANQVKLATQLLCEFFGQIVANVGASMMSLGPSLINFIVKHSRESVSNCKKAIAILIQHQMVVYTRNDKGLIEYTIKPERILLTLRYPKYIYVAKVLHNAAGEQIVEKILKDGMLTVDEVISKVTPDLTESLRDTPTENIPKLIYDTFVNMTKVKLIVPCCTYHVNTQQADWYFKEEEEEDSELDSNSLLNWQKVPPFKPPKLDHNNGDNDDILEPCKKKRKKETESGDTIYWIIDVKPFHTIIRDMMIAESLRSHYGDDIAAQIVEIMLRCGAGPNPNKKETQLVPKNEIEKNIPDGLFQSKEDLSTYLLFLSDDASGFVIQSEERVGIPMYQVNTFNIIDKLVKSCMCSAVVDRFGSKAGRIFNLLLHRKLLPQKQIEEMAMIDPKDAKECAYNLFKNRFIKIMHFAAQNDYTPSKTCFLFGTDLEEVCRSTIERCYQAIMNCIIRRNHENHIHKSLIDRKILIEAVITNLRMQPEPQSGLEQQIEELNQSFSSHDRELIEKLKTLSFTLEMCELKIDETLFLMQTWLNMND